MAKNFVVNFSIFGNSSSAEKALKKTQQSIKSTSDSAEQFGRIAAKAFAGLAGALAGAGVAGKLVEVEREFGVLMSSLKTVTGSTEAAGQAFKTLESLASTLPVSIPEITEAFIKMQALGLEPSKAALISYTNTASAMGKSLEQFVEAVADASTGEFERLKEFGIKASSEGDKVALTFQGVTTRIGKNADEITKYLQNIGDTTFAGAAAERMATLDGRISNLGVAWDSLFRTINGQGAGELISEGVVLATEAIQTLTDLIGSGALQERIANIGLAFSDAFDLHDNAEAALKTYGGSLDGMESATEETVKFIIDAFKDWPENVAALVKIVAVELGSLVDIAALKAEDIAAAANPKNWFTSGDLEEVNDELTRAIESRDRLLSSGLNDSIPVVKALNKQIEELTAEQTRLNAELEQHEGRYKAVDQARKDSIAAILAERGAEHGAAADRAKHADQTLKDYRAQQAAAKGLNDVIADMPQVAEEAGTVGGESAQEIEKRFKAATIETQGLVDALGNLRGELDPVYKKTLEFKREQQVLDAALASNLITLSDYVDLLGLLNAKYKETTDTVIKYTDKTDELTDKADPMAKAWEKAVERIDASFADAWKGAFDSFESFTDSILDGLKGLAAEIAHINITKPLTDQLAGVFSGGGGLNLGLSGLFGGSGASAGKGGQAVIGADAALGQGGLTGALQGGFIAAGATLTANAIATVFDDNASNARRRNNLALLSGGLGALIPSSVFGKPTDSTQKATYDLSTGTVSDAGSLTGSKFSQQNRDAADYAALVAYNLADYLQGKTGNKIADSLGLVVGNRDGIRAEINGNEIARGTDAGAVLSQLTDELLRLSGVSGEVYKSLSQDGEELYQTLIRVDSQFVTVSAITDKLHLNFGALGDAGLTASDALIQAAGGLESLVAKTDYYYQNFYSEQERLQNIIDMSNGALTDFNVSMGSAISDKDGLRAFVDALDLTTEAGQAAYAAALDLAPSLVDLGTAQARLAEITQTAKRELVAMDDVSDMTVGKIAEVTAEMKKLTEQADAFAGGLSRDALLEGLNGYDRDVFLLDEWKTKAIEQLQAFTDQGVAILGGPEKVLADIEKIYGIRLGEINERYTDSVHIVDEYIVATEDLGESISNVIDLSDYLAELERQRADAINDVMSAYERESKVFETTADKFSRFADTLRDFDKELLTGDLSTLNPAAQYSESRSQFADLAQRAQKGDESAISQLTGAANSFLTESRSFQGSAGTYARDFDFVRQTLANTISTSEKQASNAEQQLAQLKAQVSEIVSLKAEVKTLQEAIAALVQVEREAGNAMIQQQQQTNQTLNGLKSNSDLQRAAS